jgi:MoaA/NifB/PqqE/SkfB family radical SAM enzyme
MTNTNLDTGKTTTTLQFPLKLWVYTNYDCNLRCSYCVAESSPRAPRRSINFTTARKIVDQALALGFEQIYFTGGEPFILNEIFTILAYSSNRLPTTVLTNAMLFRGKRLEQLVAINNQNLTIQVSLDGSRSEHHDPYRGPGTWQKTVNGIHKLKQHNFRIRISTTETPANRHHLDDIGDFRRALGIADQDHIIRPLAKRGFSTEGVQVSKHCLLPELTINAEGVYWHPLSTDPDLLVTRQIFPLSKALAQAKTEFHKLAQESTAEMQAFQ